MFIISGAIHKRALIFYGNLCRLQESSIEKQLARRQQAINDLNSSSWYVDLRKILVKYDLPSCWDLLDDPPKKEHWRRIVNKQVNGYWSTKIKQSIELYPSFKYLSADEYWPGRRHQLIQQVRRTRDIPRISTRLKLVTGTPGVSQELSEREKFCDIFRITGRNFGPNFGFPYTFYTFKVRETFSPNLPPRLSPVLCRATELHLIR